MPLIRRAYWDGGQVTDTLDSSRLAKQQMMPEKRRFPVIWEMSHANEVVRSHDTVPTLAKRMGTGDNQVPLIGLRRLTPLECERLQAFPDNWTAVNSDTQRYKELGNAVTVSVIKWLADRLVRSE